MLGANDRQDVRTHRGTRARPADREDKMIKRIALAAVVTVAFAGQALAAHCPADVKAIDNALAKMSVPADKKPEIMSLRNEGDALHKAGKHKESVDTLAKAMRMILNSQ
jgi:hypothetical protein